MKAVLCLDFYASRDVFRRNGIVQQICIVNNHFELERSIPIYVRKDSMSECVWIYRKASPKRGLSIGKSEFIRTFRFMFFYMEIGDDFVLTAGYFFVHNCVTNHQRTLFLMGYLWIKIDYLRR